MALPLMPAVTKDQLEAKIATLEQRVAESQQRTHGLFQQGVRIAEAALTEASAEVAAISEQVVAAMDDGQAVDVAPWVPDVWRTWKPERALRWERLRAGTARDSTDEQVVLSAHLPFIGQARTIVVHSGEGYGGHDQAKSLFHSLLIRTALALPHEASYTLLDPSGAGKAFPMRRMLPNVRQNSDDVRRDLDSVNADIRRIIETYLDASTTSFEMIPEDLRLNERFHFVFAANLPDQYDLRAIEALQSIAKTGGDAGIYLFVHHNHDLVVQGDGSRYAFENAYDVTPSTIRLIGPAELPFDVTPDACPEPPLQQAVFANLAAAAPVERKIDWHLVAGLDNADWWRERSDTRIVTPIGKHGSNKRLDIWFGTDDEGRPCVHGVIGAMPGAGKSTLFHCLIAGLVTRYSPEELRLYLIDGKFGVEFEPYKQLPHAEVVSLKTSPELSRSVLAELVDEMKRRNGVFQRNGVTDLPEYRRAGQPDGSLPRLLLVVDEYQQLFEDDRDDRASKLLRQLSEQGRSAGLHMLLASQRFGAAGMVNQTAIFGNIHLRMAMQMADADVKALTEFGPRGRGLIQVSCNLPGKIVVNDRAGDDGGNIAGKVAFLEDDDHRKLLRQVAARAQSLPSEMLPQRVVFNGEEQPDLLDNPLLVSLLTGDTWPEAGVLEELARRPITEGGLGVVDWFAAESPVLGFAGQEFTVRGQARIVLRRRGAENAAVVGGNNAARYGILAGLLAGLATTGGPGRLGFRIADHSVPGSDWHVILATAVEKLLEPVGYEANIVRDDSGTLAQLEELLAECERREALAPADRAAQPAIIWVISDLDRSEAYRKESDVYGLTESENGRRARELFTKGPALGLHTIASFDGVRSLLTVIDDRLGLGQFRHRVALQMSEDDAFLFTRGRAAAQLQSHGDTPVAALYLDSERERLVRFKPYTVETQASSLHGSLAEQFAVIGARLSQRK